MGEREHDLGARGAIHRVASRRREGLRHGLLSPAIEALRTRRSPPEGASARVLARLEAQLGGPGGPDDGGFDGGSGGGHGTAAFAAKVVAATAGMAAGGLLVLKLGVLGYRSLAPSDPPTPVIAPASAIIDATPPLADTPVQPSPDPESAISSAPTSDEPPAVVRSPSKPTPTPAPTPDITAELALIEAARQAGSPEATIAQLAKHAREFPKGTLRDEREALWAIASCERGALDDASQRAQALGLRRPNSPLLDRVANACPALGKK